MDGISIKLGTSQFHGRFISLKPKPSRVETTLNYRKADTCGLLLSALCILLALLLDWHKLLVVLFIDAIWHFHLVHGRIVLEVVLPRSSYRLTALDPFRLFLLVLPCPRSTFVPGTPSISSVQAWVGRDLINLDISNDVEGDGGPLL